MKKRDRKSVRNVDVKFREIPRQDLERLKRLVDSAEKEKAPEPEHVER